MSKTTGFILLTIIALILHLLEEINTGFRSRLPVGEMSLRLFVTINVVVYAFCFTALVLSASGGRLATPFAWVFALAMLLNGMGHVGTMLVTRGYCPGGARAILLLQLSGYLILHLLGE
ncbi:MAG: HXXEE domain-containing protein [Anaerolineae bacterium]